MGPPTLDPGTQQGLNDDPGTQQGRNDYPDSPPNDIMNEILAHEQRERELIKRTAGRLNYVVIEAVCCTQSRDPVRQSAVYLTTQSPSRSRFAR